ncbi:MAG: hypothetical protein K0S46_2161 [Moraxellaceae bacterium]|jgi:hypothetical protein|nr:hypothetical protein [Moraxellaceae bacterium]
MSKFKPVLSGKGLLAASVALLSGQALAEAAGRVSFVTGDVSVSAADGSKRNLVRGDTINGGDRITTRAGRVQVRFTDGGFVSLQPNTVFAVDEYLYTNRKPEETSLFFSLIQGGMRTVTGAIGKVNKKSYQVRTPVATIGIRGTEYLASVNDEGLIVSVGSGLVNVANQRGEITAGAGQNIHVGPDGQPALGKKEAELLARRTKPDEAEESEDTGQRDDEDDDTVVIGDVLDGEGRYIFLQTGEASLPDSSRITGAPRYTIDSPALIGSYRGAEMSANFDQTGAATGQPGALQNLFYVGDGFFSYFNIEDLKVANVGTQDSLSWGEYTFGETTTNSIFDSCGECGSGPISLTGSYTIPYVIGAPAGSNLGKGTATYTLQGGTAPRDLYSGTTGRLDGFRITVNLDFATISAAFKVSMPGNAAAEASANSFLVRTVSPVALLNLGTAQTFELNDSQLKVTDSSGVCASSSGSCTANLTGFFAGAGASQMGVSYRINSWTSYPDIVGVAALGMSAYDGSTKLDDGPGYTVAYAYPWVAAATGGTTGYDTTTGLQYDGGLIATFDNDGLLVQALAVSDSQALKRGTATLADNYGKADALTWGRWYATTSDNAIVENNPVALSNTTYLHYIAGPMTHANVFSGIVDRFGAGAKATYTFQGGTTATSTDGATGKILSGSNLVVTFGALPTLAIDLKVGMSDSVDYRLLGSGIGITVDATAAKFTAGSGNMSCSTSAGGSGGGCAGSVAGFFAGQQAKQIGMSYEIYDFSVAGGRHVNGAGAFGRGTISKALAPIDVVIPF